MSRPVSRRRRPWQHSRKMSFRRSSRRQSCLPVTSVDDSKRKRLSSTATDPPARQRRSSAGDVTRSTPGSTNSEPASVAWTLINSRGRKKTEELCPKLDRPHPSFGRTPGPGRSQVSDPLRVYPDHRQGGSRGLASRARVEGFRALPSDGGRTAQPPRLPAAPGSQDPTRKKIPETDAIFQNVQAARVRDGGRPGHAENLHRYQSESQDRRILPRRRGTRRRSPSRPSITTCLPTPCWSRWASSS